MAIEWEEASSSVLSTAQYLIDRHHRRLEDFRILFMFRSEPGVFNGNTVYAKTQKVSNQMKALLDNADFIIWVSKDDWNKNPEAWREALIDHELTHCGVYEDGSLYIRGHDIEEFNEIIERHGIWRSDILRTRNTFERLKQLKMPGLESIELSSGGKVVTMTPEKFDQVVTEFAK